MVTSECTQRSSSRGLLTSHAADILQFQASTCTLHCTMSSDDLYSDCMQTPSYPHMHAQHSIDADTIPHLTTVYVIRCLDDDLGCPRTS